MLSPNFLTHTHTKMVRSVPPEIRMSEPVARESFSSFRAMNGTAPHTPRRATVATPPPPEVLACVTGPLPSPFVVAPAPVVCFPPPAVPYGCMNPALCSDTQGLSRLFVGQVPYHLHAANVAWLLSSLTGRVVWRVEKIVRWRDRQHTSGCYHVYVAPEDESHFLARHQTALCLPFVVCVSTNPLQRQALVALCQQLRDVGPTEGAAPTPTQLLTVEKAKSTFVRTLPDRRRPLSVLVGGALSELELPKDSLTSLLHGAVPTDRMSP